MKFVASIAAISFAVTLGACRKEEQNRPTSFTPGVYRGEAMPTLTKEQIAELAKRGQLLK
jgi:hypothetical protein